MGGRARLGAHMSVAGGFGEALVRAARHERTFAEFDAASGIDGLRA